MSSKFRLFWSSCAALRLYGSHHVNPRGNFKFVGRQLFVPNNALRRNFHLSSTCWRTISGTGPAAGGYQTGILCPRCGNTILEFFLTTDKFVRCQKCFHVFKTITAKEMQYRIRSEAAEADKKKHKLTPKEIADHLDKYVIGQKLAKKVLSVAVYNHCKRISHSAEAQSGKRDAVVRHMDDVWNSREFFPVNHALDAPHLNAADKGDEDDKFSAMFKNTTLDKSNIMLIGPTGSGKTLLAQSVAKHLDVPFAICDCTNLTQAGYVGEDIESVIAKLLKSANSDVNKAQTGIVFLDEIDKIFAASGHHQWRDVSGQGVQQAMLKMLEGTVMNVTDKSSRRARAETMSVDTTNILFVASGAFTGLDKLIGRRTQTNSFGFAGRRQQPTDGDLTLSSSSSSSPSSDRSDVEKQNAERDELLKKVTPRDLVQFGMIPEFVGRFPVLVPFHSLNRKLLVEILTEPKNSTIKQFQLLFGMDKVDLTFTEDALLAIAEQALERNTGARGLRSIVESILLDPMYELPGSDVVSVRITAEMVTGKNRFRYMRGDRLTDDDETKSQKPSVTCSNADKPQN
ncbi:ATP-dependent Clp protease ATP-binding subunit clpX-like, mitochondrial [Adelges cooleyi]|uniref:ATP-dependent Clp protease ATP-binding subunit clpX-like, mitochondrial n=1 Tax=Adelges cooleyi TaxID=133065 RepID=UPI00217F7A03|nr:ATP-dependent Clp protease ATP-binding subunit clpX-like, mitochondrial [Adelges cooleyi]